MSVVNRDLPTFKNLQKKLFKILRLGPNDPTELNVAYFITDQIMTLLERSYKYVKSKTEKRKGGRTHRIKNPGEYRRLIIEIQNSILIPLYNKVGNIVSHLYDLSETIINYITEHYEM